MFGLRSFLCSPLLKDFLTLRVIIIIIIIITELFYPDISDRDEACCVLDYFKKR